MTKQTEIKPTRDMIWGEIMLCLEILALLSGIQFMDMERFFRKPNETYSQYFINKLSHALFCINKNFSSQMEKVNERITSLIASMPREEFMSNEPLSAEAFFSYHRSDLRSLHRQAAYVRHWANKEKEK